MTPTNEKLTTAEFAAAVDCPQPTVHGWVARGILTPAGKRGKTNVFDQKDVEAMIKYRKTRPAKTRRTGSASPVTLAAVSTLKLVQPPDVADGHRYWSKGVADGDVETLAFGPIALNTRNDNTASGQAMVPMADPHFEFDAGEAVVLANAMKNAEPTFIWGPSGAGKTSGIQQMCALLNQPLYRVNMSGDFTVADFVGSTKVVVDEASGQAITEFVDGVLLKAMLNGGVLLIDEVTATPASVLMSLQAILERAAEDVHALWAKGRSHAVYVNTENGGEVIHCHPRFRVIVTDNTNGQGDITGAYSGTNVMNEAFRSRFTQWLQKGYPTKESWIKMIAAKTGTSVLHATKIVTIATDVNDGSALLGASRVTNQTVINPRDTLAIARLFKVYGDLKIAFRVGLIDSMHSADADRQFVIDLLNNHVKA